MADIVIGGKSYPIPELTLNSIKKVSRLALKLVEVQAGADSPDRLDASIDVAVAIIGIWLSKTNPELTADVIGETMTITELQGVEPAIMKSLTEAGLKASGETKAAPAAPRNPRKR